MKLSIDLGSWTTTKAMLAVAGALAIGGAVGSALAISPTLTAPIKWGGGWELTRASLAGILGAYQVPQGRNLMLTDIVLSNTGDITALFHVGTGGGDPSQPCLFYLPARLQYIVVPAGQTTSISLTTGVGFPSGKTMCIQSQLAPVNVNLRGYLFTAAPAS